MANSKDLKAFIIILRIYKLLPVIYFIIFYYYRAYIFIFIEKYSLDFVTGRVACKQIVPKDERTID